ncbi:hypothetical protein VB741_13340 [Leptothoe sp. PORK10 BA2]|nr:hypothetical protein [Leptothoe sp. PORK10 BA2]
MATAAHRKNGSPTQMSYKLLPHTEKNLGEQVFVCGQMDTGGVVPQ